MPVLECAHQRDYVFATPAAGSARVPERTEGILSDRIRTGAARAETGGATRRSTTEDSDAMLALVLASLDDDKAEDVVSIDLRGRSSFADHMVVASGRSARQVSAIAEKLMDRVKAATGRSARAEGKDAGDWVLIDCGDVIVHVFRPEVRNFYQIEKMWMDPADMRARLAATA